MDCCLPDNYWQRKRHPGAPDQAQRGGGDEVVRAAGFESCDAADEDGGHQEQRDAHGSGDGGVEGTLKMSEGVGEEASASARRATSRKKSSSPTPLMISVASVMGTLPWRMLSSRSLTGPARAGMERTMRAPRKTG